MGLTNITTDLSLGLLGKPNGFAPLGADLKVPAGNLPSGVATNGLVLQGVYNATTNTPDLTNVAQQVDGHLYIVDVAGDQDIGNGLETFTVGDSVFWSGTEGKWYKLQGTVLAVEAVFDPTGSTLVGVNVQDAIIELNDKVDNLPTTPLPATEYYVRVDGDDSNNGQIDSAGGAFATIDRFVEELYSYRLDPAVEVTLWLGDGTHDVDKQLLLPYVKLTVRSVSGDPALCKIRKTLTPADPVDNPGIFIEAQATLTIFQVELEAPQIDIPEAAAFAVFITECHIDTRVIGFAGNTEVYIQDCTIFGVLGVAADSGWLMLRSRSNVDWGTGNTFDASASMLATKYFASCFNYSRINFEEPFTFIPNGERFLNLISQSNAYIRSGTTGDIRYVGLSRYTINDTGTETFVDYDNTTSGLTAVTKQGAIDEIVATGYVRESAPGTSIYWDADVGNDANDGFSLGQEVATAGRVQELLFRYDWNGGGVNIQVRGATAAAASLTLIGVGVQNLTNITIRSTLQPRTGTTTLQFFESVEFFGTDFSGNSAGINVFNCHSLDISGTCDIINRTSGNWLIVDGVAYVSIGGVGIAASVNGTATLMSVFDVAYFSYDPDSSSGFTVSKLLDLNNSVQFVDLGNGGGAITGQVIDASECGNVEFSESGWAFTGTVADAFPAHYIYNGSDYDNTTSGLTATTKQAAIDELALTQPLKTPPGALIEIAAAGDDANDGFSAPVATNARLQEIIDSHDWSTFEGFGLTINIDTDLVIDGKNAKGCTDEVYISHGVDYTSNLRIYNFNDPRVEVFYTPQLTGAGFVNCRYNTNIDIDFGTITNSTAFQAILIQDCPTVSITNPNTVNGNVTRMFRVNGVKRLSVDTNITGTVVCTDYLSLENIDELTLDFAGSGNITGRLLNARDCEGVRITAGGPVNIVSTVPDIYPSSYVELGTLVTRGQDQELFNRETIVANKTLAVSDNVYQHIIANTAALLVDLPASPVNGTHFIIKNSDSSSESFTTNSTVINPGELYEAKYDGTEWVVL